MGPVVLNQGHVARNRPYIRVVDLQVTTIAEKRYLGHKRSILIMYGEVFNSAEIIIRGRALPSTPTTTLGTTRSPIASYAT